MTNVETTYNNQTSVAEVHASNWQKVIWREWRNCGDEEYAQHLFELVASEPTKWWMALIPGLLGAILGVSAGWLEALLFYPLAWFEGTSIVGIFWEPIIGGAIGFLLVVGLHLSRRPTWGMLLRGLLPTKPLIQKEAAKSLDSVSFLITFGLSSGMGVGMTGAIFFGQSNSQFYYLLGGLILAFLLIFYLEGRISIIVFVANIVIGSIFGSFFGLGFAQLAGLLVGPFDLGDSGRVVGVVTGLAVGLYMGRGVGLTGLLIWQIAVTFIVLTLSVNLVLVGWLVGILVGGVFTSIGEMWGDKLDFASAYSYRTLCFWWLQRPFATQVEAALRSYPGEANWIQPLLQELEAQQQQPGSPDRLGPALGSNNWRDRFLAWHASVMFGYEVLSDLIAFTAYPYRGRTAKWLVRSIGHETALRLADKAEQLICPNCLTTCGPHRANGSGISTTYYGCRICGQSREFLETPAGVVAVLDTNWKQQRRHQNGLLRVNWLKRRELFDFDRVEIIRATDEEAERFAVQVGNDTDPLRTARYPQMQCAVSPECDLSENTLRVLRRTFGTVEQEAG